ncbi:trafficking kinesin-binding protein 1-like [Anoplopoma fimbria]|uniref:trafficking kinesin-binding protein 1-like n=1 Tax=Anoplopoma fimbria TaxID=229290 RepID=UPI0023EAC847|nr:trafficking kinesin-binding protein 1-like [Anoplopoma fimbria]
MTKTYNDIDAVTRLLEEKERDLELAARIGQSLLKKNRTLTEQNEYLEERVAQITEEVAQLHHELNLKDELLQFYTNAAEESEDESSSSPTSKVETASGGTLQKKLQELEEENLSLRSEAHHLKSETEIYEEKEQQLVNECVKELRLSSLQISTIAEELARKTGDASRQQEEITHLLSQIVDLQKKTKSFAVENEELSQHLVAAKDAQRQLTAELQELDEKYLECIEMLHEAQEELKNLRNRNFPAGTPRRFHPLGLYPMDSLAAEIEGTMRKELSLDDPECEEQNHRRRVFETVKNVNQTVRQRSLTPTNANIPGSNQSLSARTSPQSSGLCTPHSSVYGGDVSGDGVALDNRTQSILMETAANQDSNTDNRDKKATGPEDLRIALRRLSLRRQNNLSERRFFEDERRRGGHGGLHDSLVQESPLTPSESIMSLGNLHLWASRGPYLPDKLQIVKPLEGSATLHHWQQLAQPHLGVILDARPGVVPKGYRPLELELEQVYPWGGFEEDEPGEQYFQNLPTSSTSTACASPAVTSTSSTTEANLVPPPPSLVLPDLPSPSPSPHLSNTDVLAAYYPGKSMAHTSSTYTFTTCRILHPTDELTRVTPSLNPVPASSSCVMTSTLLGTPIATPCTPRRLGLRPSESSTNLRDATRTTSTSLGLVRLLQERGISAAMYHQSQGSEYGQGGVLFSTSITPNRAPNPDPLGPSTPPSSPTGQGASAVPTSAGFDFKSPSYDNFLTSKPARSILKEVTGRMRGRQRGKDCESQTDVSVTVHNLNLLDKVKRLGVGGGPGGRAMSPGPILGPLGGLRRSGSPFGPEGMRRNRSYPAMVGASMAMKAPGPQE